MLSVCYLEKGKTLYHQYTGGTNWIPTLPKDIAHQGEELTACMKVLTVKDFIRSIPCTRFINDEGFDWVAQTSRLLCCDLDGSLLTAHFVQEPYTDSDAAFSLVGTITDSIGTGSVSGPYLDAWIADMFGLKRKLRFYFNGINAPALGIDVGEKFGVVHIVSHDGERLALGYERAAGDFRTAFLYQTSPAILYSLSDAYEYSLPFQVKGYTKCMKIDNATPLRSMENEMCHDGNKNVIGRIGGEIAYKVATEVLGLDRVVIQDPSQSGSDLYTQDGRVLIEARLLQRTKFESGFDLHEDITAQLNQMTRKLISDLARKSASLGYAIFSFVESGKTPQTLILEVPRHK